MKLTRLLRKCKNEKVKIETKDGMKIEGFIAYVDKTMNTEVSDAMVNDVHVGVHTIRGGSIRYIMFRDDIDFKPLLVDDRPKSKSTHEEPIKRRKTNV